jgi:hypothetical protein
VEKFIHSGIDKHQTEQQAKNKFEDFHLFKKFKLIIP